MDQTMEGRPASKVSLKGLGSLEQEVMQVVWQLGQASVREVLERLRRERDIAYTTVMTIMTRLADKGLLVRRKAGLAYVYAPLYSREEFNQSLVAQVVDTLVEDYGDAAFSHFINKMWEQDPVRLAELEKILRERLAKGEK
ncbi:MAG: BlaI/MecI/CopY family transcriptional regulator [Bacillota bacterium]